MPQKMSHTPQTDRPQTQQPAPTQEHAGIAARHPRNTLQRDLLVPGKGSMPDSPESRSTLLRLDQTLQLIQSTNFYESRMKYLGRERNIFAGVLFAIISAIAIRDYFSLFQNGPRLSHHTPLDPNLCDETIWQQQINALLKITKSILSLQKNKAFNPEQLKMALADILQKLNKNWMAPGIDLFKIRQAYIQGINAIAKTGSSCWNFALCKTVDDSFSLTELEKIRQNLLTKLTQNNQPHSLMELAENLRTREVGFDYMSQFNLCMGAVGWCGTLNYFYPNGVFVKQKPKLQDDTLALIVTTKQNADQGIEAPTGHDLNSILAQVEQYHSELVSFVSQAERENVVIRWFLLASLLATVGMLTQGLPKGLVVDYLVYGLILMVLAAMSAYQNFKYYLCPTITEQDLHLFKNFIAVLCNDMPGIKTEFSAQSPYILQCQITFTQRHQGLQPNELARIISNNVMSEGLQHTACWPGTHTLLVKQHADHLTKLIQPERLQRLQQKQQALQCYQLFYEIGQSLQKAMQKLHQYRFDGIVAIKMQDQLDASTGKVHPQIVCQVTQALMTIFAELFSTCTYIDYAQQPSESSHLPTITIKIDTSINIDEFNHLLTAVILRCTSNSLLDDQASHQPSQRHTSGRLSPPKNEKPMASSIADSSGPLRAPASKRYQITWRMEDGQSYTFDSDLLTGVANSSFIYPILDNIELLEKHANKSICRAYAVILADFFIWLQQRESNDLLKQFLMTVCNGTFSRGEGQAGFCYMKKELRQDFVNREYSGSGKLKLYGQNGDARFWAGQFGKSFETGTKSKKKTTKPQVSVQFAGSEPNQDLHPMLMIYQEYVPHHGAGFAR